LNSDNSAPLLSVKHKLVPSEPEKRNTPLANTPQARKRARQNETRRLRNRSQRSTMRTQIKAFTNQLEAGDTEAANNTYVKAASVIDHSARKGLLHRNKAARLKSRMNTRLKAAAA